MLLQLRHEDVPEPVQKRKANGALTFGGQKIFKSWSSVRTDLNFAVQAQILESLPLRGGCFGGTSRVTKSEVSQRGISDPLLQFRVV